jgi:hypothetical protein
MTQGEIHAHHTQSTRGPHLDERWLVVEVPRTLLLPPLVPRDGLCLMMRVTSRQPCTGHWGWHELITTCTDRTHSLPRSLRLPDFHVSGLRVGDQCQVPSPKKEAPQLGETNSSTRRCALGVRERLEHSMLCKQPDPVRVSDASCRHVRPSSSRTPDNA